MPLPFLTRLVAFSIISRALRLSRDFVISGTVVSYLRGNPEGPAARNGRPSFLWAHDSCGLAVLRNEAATQRAFRGNDQPPHLHSGNVTLLNLMESLAFADAEITSDRAGAVQKISGEGFVLRLHCNVSGWIPESHIKHLLLDVTKRSATKIYFATIRIRAASRLMAFFTVRLLTLKCRQAKPMLIARLSGKLSCRAATNFAIFV
jgi:hypothetical protein